MIKDSLEYPFRLYNIILFPHYCHTLRDNSQGKFNIFNIKLQISVTNGMGGGDGVGK